MHGQYPARDDPNTLFNAVKQLYTQKAKLRDEKALVRPSAECASSAGAPGNNATPSPTTVTFVDFSKEGLMGMPALDDKTGWSKLLTTKHPALVRLKKDDTLYKVIKLADKSDSVNSQSINAHRRDPKVLRVDLQSIDNVKVEADKTVNVVLDSAEIKTIYCNFFGGSIAVSPSITISVGTTIKDGAMVKTTSKMPNGKVEVRSSKVKFLVAMLDEPFEIGGEDEKDILLKDCPTILRLMKAAGIELGKPEEFKISTSEAADMLRILFKLDKDTKLDNNRRLVQSLIKEAEAALAEKDSLIQKIAQLAKLGFLQPPPPSSTDPRFPPHAARVAAPATTAADEPPTAPPAAPSTAEAAGGTADDAVRGAAGDATGDAVDDAANGAVGGSEGNAASSAVDGAAGGAVDDAVGGSEGSAASGAVDKANNVWSSIASYGLMPSLKSQQISKSQQVAYDEWYKQQHAPSKANEQAADKALKVAQFKAEKAIRKQAKKETDAALKSAIEPKDDDFHSPASVQKFIDLRLKPKAKPITPSLAFALGKSPARLPLTIPLNHVNRSPSTNSASQNIRT